MWSVCTGHNQIVQHLLGQSDIELNCQSGLDGSTAFFVAALKGNLEAVQLLLDDWRVDVNRTDRKGYTPLHAAANLGLADITKLLVAHHRLEVNCISNLGWTPLHCAARKGNAEVVQVLMGL